MCGVGTDGEEADHGRAARQHRPARYPRCLYLFFSPKDPSSHAMPHPFSLLKTHTCAHKYTYTLICTNAHMRTHIIHACAHVFGNMLTFCVIHMRAD